MSPQMNGEPRIAAATDAGRPPLPTVKTDRVTKTPVNDQEQLAPLFSDTTAADFRRRWDLVQRSFVDDPRKAVLAADELVAQVTNALAESFASQGRDSGVAAAEVPTTENLRIALRQYRSFFERLLSI